MQNAVRWTRLFCSPNSVEYLKPNTISSKRRQHPVRWVRQNHTLGDVVDSQRNRVSLSYSITWIMSQRILIHLRDAGAPKEPHTAVTHHLQSLQDINTAIRAYALSPTRPQHELHRAQDRQAGEDLAELNLPVRIGRSIVADDRSHPVATPLDKALYTSQKAIWEQRQDV
ncbi:hypothetical protein HETIRDRAFT_162620 [Heterobasidion irregulare TC 32-1]|uniref:Uncharacterized protein n=1 Tax=Heterobasidion irregulare (strain TC 32-1) TaxID=747525 RepID=W4JQV6_HETIT|nr:uncharacterized protein HETIRDRAFT_162620 [Heterobasidion irregulare TC 32-1]ETW75844.1 hypothetical protein HETIRDRAFT_162620 [Heterobasidion irregulare TC 32-1]